MTIDTEIKTIASKLLSQGIAKSHLDAMRMAESMVKTDLKPSGRKIDNLEYSNETKEERESAISRYAKTEERKQDNQSLSSHRPSDNTPQKENIVMKEPHIDNSTKREEVQSTHEKISSSEYPSHHEFKPIFSQSSSTTFQEESVKESTSQTAPIKKESEMQFNIGADVSKETTIFELTSEDLNTPKEISDDLVEEIEHEIKEDLLDLTAHPDKEPEVLPEDSLPESEIISEIIHIENEEIPIVEKIDDNFDELLLDPSNAQREQPEVDDISEDDLSQKITAGLKEEEEVSELVLEEEVEEELAEPELIKKETELVKEEEDAIEHTNHSKEKNKKLEDDLGFEIVDIDEDITHLF